jgi:5-methylcytosine-specific restriction endonuclease McrA
MKNPATKYKTLLKQISFDIQTIILNEINDARIIPIKKLAVEETDTFGWSVDLFKFRNIEGRGTIQIWLDYFPNVNRPILSIAFWSTDLGRIKKIALNNLDNFTDDHQHKTLNIGNGLVLENPLQKKYFEKFLIEPYPTKYFSYYFFENLDIRNSDLKPFAVKVSKKTKWLIRAVVESLQLKNKITTNNFSFENKIIYQLHKKRERSKDLAEKVKLRDEYQCKVCDLNFTDRYGVYGNGFAEAHHIVPLSKIQSVIKTTEKDLITVCSNCHKMLHRMSGKRDDYITLRKIVKKNNKKVNGKRIR